MLTVFVPHYCLFSLSTVVFSIICIQLFALCFSLSDSLLLLNFLSRRCPFSRRASLFPFHGRLLLAAVSYLLFFLYSFDLVRLSVSGPVFFVMFCSYSGLPLDPHCQRLTVPNLPDRRRETIVRRRKGPGETACKTVYARPLRSGRYLPSPHSSYSLPSLPLHSTFHPSVVRCPRPPSERVHPAGTLGLQHVVCAFYDRHGRGSTSSLPRSHIFPSLFCTSSCRLSNVSLLHSPLTSLLCVLSVEPQPTYNN